MDLVRGGIKIIEQPLGVKRSAGSGDGDEDFQSVIPFAPSMGRLMEANKFASALRQSSQLPDEPLQPHHRFFDVVEIRGVGAADETFAAITERRARDDGDLFFVQEF